LLLSDLLDLEVVGSPHDCLTLTLGHAKVVLKVDFDIDLVSLCRENLDLKSHKVVSECFEDDVYETLGRDFVDLTSFLDPDVHQTYDILPAVWLVLPLVQEIQWDLIYHLHGDIQKHERLDPIFQHFLQSEVLLFWDIELVILINHYHAH
jgi:hypothetical protein